MQEDAFMNFFQSIVMGIVQGLTEFLPVSSSGHLAIFKQILNIQTDTGILFDVLLHMGTLLAICLVYYKDVKQLILDGCGLIADLAVNLAVWIQNLVGKTERKAYRKLLSSAGRKFVLLLIISTIPTGIIGVIGGDIVEVASETLIVPGICLLITAVLLLIADGIKPGKKKIGNVTYTNGFVLGICQGVATLPGISRSGTTITACLLSGFDRNLAVKYSFLMSIPAVLGAAVLELKDVGSLSIGAGEWFSYIVGMLVAAVVGYICIKAMLVVVRKKKFKGFSIYCAIVGIVAIIGSFLK
jgi:undecaprenyl-diphosphatase